MDFLKTIKQRRTNFNIDSEITVSDETLIEDIKTIVYHAPSPFNTQHQSVVIALGDTHRAVWDAIIENVKASTSKKRFETLKGKIEGFKKGYGTVLFYDDVTHIRDYQERFAKVKDRFETWMHQAQGMVQINVWNLLASYGLAASLQHYNPSIDDDMKALFNTGDEMILRAQMPFGVPSGDVKTKDFKPIEQRVLIKK